MSITRRHFVSCSAVAAATAALPTIDAKAIEPPALENADDMSTILDAMERQIVKIREHLAKRDAAPDITALTVRRETAAMQHRTTILASKARILRKLSDGESLAEQQAAWEKEQEKMREIGYAARARVNTIKGFGDLIASGQCAPAQHQNYAALITRQGRALEAEITRVFAAMT